MNVSEYRQDPISKSWSIIAPKRVGRPKILKGAKDIRDIKVSEDFKKDPFAEGNEGMTPKEVLRIGKGAPNKPGWDVRVFPNKFPITDFHEVIVHSPSLDKDFHDLSTAHIEKILKAYKLRYEYYAGQRLGLFPFIFCNRGSGSGASLIHPHSQLVVFKDAPEAVFEEAGGSELYLIKEGKDVYDDYLEKELENKKRIIKETRHFVLLCPYESEWPYEFNIFPKMPKGSFSDSSPEELRDLATILSKMTKIVVEKLGDPAYNFWIHSIPSKDPSSKAYRWHLEFILRVKELGGIELGAEIMVDDKISPEDAAKFYRKYYK